MFKVARNLFGFGLVLLAGCQAKWGQVEGTVIYNNKPLANFEVQFLPDPETGTKGPMSWGMTDANGHFELVCQDGRKGVVVGHHIVIITTPGPKGAGKLPFPAKYSKSASSPLKKEVQPGAQTIDLALDAK